MSTDKQKLTGIYGGTFNLFNITLRKLGIECRFFAPDASEEEIQRVLEECNGYCYEKHEAEIRRCLKEGKTIYSGTIDFEFVDPEIGSVLKKMWKAASANGEFTGIATDLSY